MNQAWLVSNGIYAEHLLLEAANSLNLRAETLSYKEALAQDSPIQPHVAVVDIGNSGDDDYAVITGLRSRYPHSIIIVMTRFHDLPNPAKAFDFDALAQAGADEFIRYPFDPSLLVARIKSQMRQKNSLQEARHAQGVVTTLLRTVTHDVNHLLTVVQLRTNRIREQETPVTSHDLERITSGLHDIVGAVQRVGQMYKAIGQINRELVLQPCCIGSIVEKAAARAREVYFSKQIGIEVEWRTDTEVQVRTDPAVLEIHVLHNFLTNACKFTPAGGRVKIEVELKEPGVAIHIVDRGIGIPKDIQLALMQNQVIDSRMGTSGEIGTGFGFLLAKCYLEGIMGRLELKSASMEDHPSESGTSVIVYLPMS